MEQTTREESLEIFDSSGSVSALTTSVSQAAPSPAVMNRSRSRAKQVGASLITIESRVELSAGIIRYRT
jgi:hypothetical protein